MATPGNAFLMVERGPALREMKTGKLYPFKSILLTEGVSLHPGQNRRYYVRGVYLSYSTLVTDAGTAINVTSFFDNEVVYLARIVKTTLTANHDIEAFFPHILLDKEAAITFEATDISTKSCILVVAEVDDLG